jgi:hypothetical protein
MVAAAAGFYFLSVSRPPSPCERDDEPLDSRSRSTAGIEDEVNDVGTEGVVTEGEHIATSWSIWSIWNPCRQYLRGDLLLLMPSAVRAASWAGLGTCWQGSFSAARVRLLLLRAKLIRNLISEGDNALQGLFVTDKATQYWGRNLLSDPKTAQLTAKIRDMAMAGLFIMHRFWATCERKASALSTVDGLGSVPPNAHVPVLLAQRHSVTDAARRDDAQPDRAEDVSVHAWIENVSNISPEKVEMRLSARREQTILCLQEDGTSDFDSLCRGSNSSAGNCIPRVLVTRIKHSAPPHAQHGAANGNSEQGSPVSFSDDLSQEWTIAASRSDDFWENEAEARPAEVEDDDDEKGSEDERDGDAHSGRVHPTVLPSRSPAAVNRSATGSVLSATGSVLSAGWSNNTVASYVPSSSFCRSPATPGSTLFLIEDTAESKHKEDMLGRRGEQNESAPLARRLLEPELSGREEQEWNRLADLKRQEEEEAQARGRQMQAELSCVKRERDELEKRLREMEAAKATPLPPPLSSTATRMEERREQEARRRAEESRRERDGEQAERKRKEQEETEDLSIHGDSESNTAAEQKFRFEHGVSEEDVAFRHVSLPPTPPLSPLQSIVGIRDDDFWLSLHASRSESGSDEPQEAVARQNQAVGPRWTEELGEKLVLNLSSWTGLDGTGREGGGGEKSVGDGERRTASSLTAYSVASVSNLPTYSAEMHPVGEVSTERRESTGKVTR